MQGRAVVFNCYPAHHPAHHPWHVPKCVSPGHLFPPRTGIAIIGRSSRSGRILYVCSHPHLCGSVWLSRAVHPRTSKHRCGESRISFRASRSMSTMKPTTTSSTRPRQTGWGGPRGPTQRRELIRPWVRQRQRQQEGRAAAPPLWRLTNSDIKQGPTTGQSLTIHGDRSRHYNATMYYVLYTFTYFVLVLSAPRAVRPTSRHAAL